MTRDTSHITAAEFERWLASSDPGARIVYTTGFLAKSIGSGDGEDTWELKALRSATRDAGDQVHLVQRRVERDVFDYLAIKASERALS